MPVPPASNHRRAPATAGEPCALRPLSPEGTAVNPRLRPSFRSILGTPKKGLTGQRHEYRLCLLTGLRAGTRFSRH